MSWFLIISIISMNSYIFACLIIFFITNKSIFIYVKLYGTGAIVQQTCQLPCVVQNTKYKNKNSIHR